MKEEDHIARVTELFDDWAEKGRAEGMETGHSATARQAFNRLGVGPGQHYLDIGCGNGYTVRWAAGVDESVQAIGLDVSEKMVKRSRELSKDFGNVRFIHAPYPLPLLKEKTFDAIFSMEVFYYMPDLTWALLSTRRLLKPGALFACVVDYYKENPESHSWPADLDVRMKLLSEAAWRAAMEEVGLDVVEQVRLKGSGATEGNGSLLTLTQRPA